MDGGNAAHSLPEADRCDELWGPCHITGPAHDIPAPEHHQRHVLPVSETVFPLWYGGQYIYMGRFSGAVPGLTDPAEAVKKTVGKMDKS